MGQYFDRFIVSLRFLRRALIYRDLDWAKKLTTYSIPLQDVEYDRRSGHLLLRKFNVSIGKEKYDFLLEVYHWAILLTDLLQAQFHLNGQDELIVSVDGIVAKIETMGELLILYEILIDGIYNIWLSKPAVIWDIGMNVGLASIYFAGKQDVIVLGYEPFKKTYSKALINIALNPNVSDRIITFNKGLSDKNIRVHVEYNREIAECLNVFEAEIQHSEDQRFQIEEVSLEDIRQVLDSIVATYPDRAIVAKIDCEGSEYEIIQALADSGKLSLLEAIMMEWHTLKPNHDPATLINWLTSSSFRVFVPKPCRKNYGMIYAFRQN